MQSNFEAFCEGCVLRPCPFYFFAAFSVLSIFFFITTDALRISKLQYKKRALNSFLYRLFIRKQRDFDTFTKRRPDEEENPNIQPKLWLWHLAYQSRLYP